MLSRFWRQIYHEPVAAGNHLLAVVVPALQSAVEEDKVEHQSVWKNIHLSSPPLMAIPSEPERLHLERYKPNLAAELCSNQRLECPSRSSTEERQATTWMSASNFVQSRLVKCGIDMQMTSKTGDDGHLFLREGPHVNILLLIFHPGVVADVQDDIPSMPVYILLHF